MIAASLLHSGCDRPGAGARSDSQDSSDAAAWFVECAQQRGLHFQHSSGHRTRLLMPEGVCGGVALFDMDGDGDLDAFLVQAGFPLDDPRQQGSAPTSKLYRNRGDGYFDDVTEGSGAGVRLYGMGAAAADYDNDGDIDLYVTALGPNVLLRNDGNGAFTDVTSTADIGDASWGSSAAFADINGDGWLDLYVCNYLNWSIERERDCHSATGPEYCDPNAYEAPARDTLYLNRGDGTFQDISEQAGLQASFGNGLGVVASDFNDDGMLDLFVANDGMQNQLWVNQGGARFTDMALESGCAIDLQGAAKAGMGVTAADFDGDNDVDILVCNLRGETDSLFRNEGSYFFDSTGETGLAAPSKRFTRFGIGWIDFNNDAVLDLYEANGQVERHTPPLADDPYAEPNVLLRGTPDGRYEEVLPRGGTAESLIHTSRAAAFGDIDNDGGIDVLVVNRDGPAYLLRNIAPNRGHWMLLRVLDEHGRDAYNARVTITVNGKPIMREVLSAYSYCAANDPRVHFGLGEAESVEDVTVKWLDGSVESFGGVEVDRVATLRRGDRTPVK